MNTIMMMSSVPHYHDVASPRVASLMVLRSSQQYYSNIEEKLPTTQGVETV